MCVCVCVYVCEHMYSCILTFTHVSLAHILAYMYMYMHTVHVCVYAFVYGCHMYLGPFHSTIGGSKPSASFTLLFLCLCDVV